MKRINRSYLIKSYGFCIFYIGGNLRILKRNRITDADLDKIVGTKGVEELEYNKITKSLFIKYDRSIITPKRLFSALKKIFHVNKFMHKEFSTADIKRRGIITPVLDRFLNKIDKRFNERFEQCKDMTLIMPVGAATQPIKGYYKRILSRPWLQFIWQLIVF